MAIHDITYINGVTKVETEKGFIYHFELEIIQAITAQNAMVRTQRGQTDSDYVRFTELLNNYGTANIVGYLDRLANDGAYKVGAPNVNVASGIMQSPFEASAASALNSMNEQLEEIKFFIKKIAE